MLSTVFEMAETAHDPDIVFYKVLTLGICSIIGLYWVYLHIKSH